MDRKAEILQNYQEYLKDASKLFQEEQKNNEAERDNEEHARIDERKAYKEELYYYINPDVIILKNSFCCVYNVHSIYIL